MYTPAKPQFYYIKVGCKGVFVTRACFRDEHKVNSYAIYLRFLRLLNDDFQINKKESDIFLIFV